MPRINERNTLMPPDHHSQNEIWMEYYGLEETDSTSLA